MAFPNVMTAQTLLNVVYKLPKASLPSRTQGVEWG